MGIVKTFNITLKTLIFKDMRPAATIADAAEVTPPTISKICSGADTSAEVMGQIARAFPKKDDRRALLAAWITDRAAEAGFTPADIRAAFGTDTLLPIPPQIREPLECLIREAETNTDLLELIETLAATLSTAKVNAMAAADSYPLVAEDPRPAEVAEGSGPTNLPPPKVVTYPNASPAKKKPRK